MTPTRPSPSLIFSPVALPHVTDPEINDYVIEQAEREGESLLIRELLLYIERYHEDDRPGVSREVLEGYVESLAEKNVFSRAPNNVIEQIDQRTVDSETWAGRDQFYPVGTDRVSNYPKRWHEQIGPDDDLRDVVRVMTEDIKTSPHDTNLGGKGRGIPEVMLLDAATALAGYDRDDAKTELEEWRDRGELVEDADQHREARVRLRD